MRSGVAETIIVEDCRRERQRSTVLFAERFSPFGNLRIHLGEVRAPRLFASKVVTTFGSMVAMEFESFQFSANVDAVDFPPSSDPSEDDRTECYEQKH
jgi:hypothetical protein